MRIFVHDYSGHPFQAQLSRELARRGHDVVHSTCRAYVSGKGNLAGDSAGLRFVTIGDSIRLRKEAYFRRLAQETRLGLELARQVVREKPDVALLSNLPIPVLVATAAVLRRLGIPWVLWHQDVTAVALKSFAAGDVARSMGIAAKVFGAGEKWSARQAAAIIVIADSFVQVHKQWGTADKVTAIPNWAPLDEIVPVPRANAWSTEHGLDGVRTVLYSGTLGLKHHPALLVQLAERLRERGVPVRLVVVNDGPAVPVLRETAAARGVDMTLLPFQPYERLPEVLGSGDVLVVLLAPEAGQFSVPSKTLSYLCAGRPVLGLMPPDNLAARLLHQSGSAVFPPEEATLDEAAAWVEEILADPARAERLGKESRALAEREFALEGCASRFEEILRQVSEDTYRSRR
ncbi:Glycosyltransferase involved in cell wall bisynthesis [Streptomyces sp. 1222.5]|uniref:glycosyltransferase family 4 protein n=1 Tax=unclassified Streptomyces TaxID=2593676 RepID=UPI00089604A8|nr:MULTISPECIES: glycosyltransferase family 4 protein [unclassified Streptomyces]PKW05041.1 glycosyltransferase involved in cell wall biosynthesis [Streptomyces sp. 5112.2]SEB53730.1 Glycosyltransferase involved in cell wall bisynthesis [Streptomyces sp. 1222.5]